MYAAGMPRYPLPFWKHLSTGPGARRKTAVLGLVATSVVVAALAVSQNQLTTQFLNMTL